MRTEDILRAEAERDDGVASGWTDDVDDGGEETVDVRGLSGAWESQ